MQFKEFFKEISVSVEVSNYIDTNNDLSKTMIDCLDDDHLMECFAQTTWVTGGMCGNNCYDYINKRIEAEAPNDIAYIVLQALLKMGIEGVAYNTLESLVKKHDLSSEPDYYGNYSECTKACISLKVLYDLCFKSD